MIQSATGASIFRLGRRSYIRTSILGWLLFSGFLICAVVSAWLGTRLLSSYLHVFTPYLKWQDALLALCCYIALIALGGCVLIVRFLYALHAGYAREMLIVSDTTLTARDLSPENLASIFWLVGTSLSCFVAVLIGLIPEMLLAWTLHLSHPLLAVLATVVAIMLSLAGLAITLPASSFVVISWIGSFSFCRHIGSPHLYQLTNQASLSIAGFRLTIIYPDAPEALVDLKLLDTDDQRRLLHLLHERWIDSQHLWNPQLGEEIEAALEVAEQSAVLV